MFLGRLCTSDFLVFIRHGSAERVYRLEFVSNQDYSEMEFNKWCETIMIAGMQLPTVADIDRSLKNIKHALEYKFDDKDVDTVGVWERSEGEG